VVAESERLERQWIILRMLCTRRNGVTVRELSERFAVGVKTIRRDLSTL
jgi:predicted DNA-binding transcriptional regulator YafY